MGLRARPPWDLVVESVDGQTRYEELLTEYDTEILDDMLMGLAKEGKVSLLTVGDSLCVRVED